jgi:hypothetical protein
MPPAQAIFYHLGVAHARGRLMGAERGGSEGDEKEGTRIAGARTFAVVSVLGVPRHRCRQPPGAWSRTESDGRSVPRFYQRGQSDLAQGVHHEAAHR